MYYISILLLLLYILIKSSYLSYLIVVKTNTVLSFLWVTDKKYLLTLNLPTYP